jgi:hypothetical protein
VRRYRLCEKLCEKFGDLFSMPAVPPNLSTPAKRRKLPSGKVHWAPIGGARGGLTLGYRKGPKGSSWIAKVFLDGHRVERVLGGVDDDGHAPGALSHQDAIREAGLFSAGERARIERGSGATSDARSLSVADAARAYIQQRERRNPITGRDARYRLTLHVISDEKFSRVLLARPTADKLWRWRRDLPKNLRPATVNRLLNDLRAALRVCIDQHWRDLPQTLAREIEIGLRSVPSAEVARHALLSDDEIRRAVATSYDVDSDSARLSLYLRRQGQGSLKQPGSSSPTFR